MGFLASYILQLLYNRNCVASYIYRSTELVIAIDATFNFILELYVLAISIAIATVHV